MIQTQLEIPTSNLNPNRRSTDPGNPQYRPTQLEPMLNLAQASALIGLSTTTVYRLVETRQIPHYRPKGRILFKGSVLEAWLESKFQAPVTGWQLQPEAVKLQKNSRKTAGGVQ